VRKEIKKRRGKVKKNARRVRSEAASTYLRLEVTKIVWNVGDYLPWIFSNTNLKISKVGNKKQKQNNVDHSSQLLLTQGVLCYSRRRKKNRFCENRTTKSLWIRVSPLRGMSLFGISVVRHIFTETCCSLLSGTCPYEFPDIPQTLHWPSSSASSMLYSICVKLPVVRRTVSL